MNKKNDISLPINPHMDKTETLDKLNAYSIETLWDIILKLQVKLYADKEITYFNQHMPWWQDAKNMLDVGSGNGYYTNHLAKRFPRKSFYCMEVKADFVKQASERYGSNNLSFHTEDIHQYNNQLTGQFDAAQMHIVLQHLDDVHIALSNTYQYLKPNGHIIIVDYLDDLRHSSIQSTYLDTIFEKINCNNHKINIDRKASLKLMNQILDDNHPLSNTFQIKDTNATPDGKAITNKQIILDTEHDKEILFAQKLVFLQIWKAQYGLDISMSKIYDIYKNFVNNEASFLRDGIHMLVLKKIECF